MDHTVRIFKNIYLTEDRTGTPAPSLADSAKEDDPRERAGAPAPGQDPARRGRRPQGTGLPPLSVLRRKFSYMCH